MTTTSGTIDTPESVNELMHESSCEIDLQTPPHEEELHPIPPAIQIVTFLAVVLPFLGLILAIVLMWDHGFSWVQLGLLAGMYVLSLGGVGIGFHRLFTHRAFETNKFVKIIFGILGSMAVEGPLLKWVATHRRHHQLSDRNGDPHSPHLHGEGFIGFITGLWHAHVGWLFQPDIPDLSRYVGDLTRERSLRWVSRLFVLWVALGLLIPSILGGLLTMSWTGAILGLIWGGLARIFIVHHVTWSINSVCHLWGSRPYRTTDLSRNNAIFGLLGMGEGWHNNHHAFPTSARHGLRWWQIDMSYVVIRTLALLGLAWNLKLPTKQTMALKAVNRP
jgi:stearoyl-CoA desaturase (Delta-9 desaturase)